MPNLTETEIEAMAREAATHLRAGDLQSAIQVQTRLVEGLMEPGPKVVQVQHGMADHLERASSELVDSLRWSRNYTPAIALQEQLVEFLPALEEALRLGAANLRIESGTEAEAGLAQVREMAAQAPENYWYQVSLASATMYLENFTEAEEILRHAAEMAHVRKVDRAMAHEYLFCLYQRQGKTEEALGAWREAVRMDSSLRAEMLPDVCRMLIVWRKFPEARKHIAMETVQVRRLFFQGLAAFTEGKSADALAVWRGVLNTFDPVSLRDGQDEFAETCLRLAYPVGAIMALEPRVESGETSCYRSVILGLAYAQRGSLDRARWHLEIALRLGDFERPRLTLPCSAGRVLSVHSGILYNATPLDPAIRKEIEVYFVP